MNQTQQQAIFISMPDNGLIIEHCTEEQCVLYNGTYGDADMFLGLAMFGGEASSGENRARTHAKLTARRKGSAASLPPAYLVPVAKATVKLPARKGENPNCPLISLVLSNFSSDMAFAPRHK